MADSSQVTINGNTLTINPTDDLSFSRNYSVLITAGAITDLNANPYVGIQDASELNFGTIPRDISTPPSIQLPTQPFEYEEAILNDGSLTGQINDINDVIGTVVATGPNSIVTFDIIAGNESGYFAIDRNGHLTLTSAGLTAASNDFEILPNQFTLTITASDLSGTSDGVDFQIIVNNNPADDPDVELNLVFGVDILTGGAGNDTFIASIVNNGTGTLVDSLENFDSLDGGTGTDVLNATIQGSSTLSPTLRNIEIVNVRAVASTIIDFANATGVQQIWNNGSSAGTTVAFTAAPIAATFGIRNTTSATNITIADGLTGDADTLSLSVAGAGNAATLPPTFAAVTSANVGSIEALNIAATGANLINVSTFTALTSLTVTGTGSLNANVAGSTALETVNASGNSGGVTLDLSAVTSDLTVTGGSGNDDITIGQGNDTVEGGRGDDRVAVASGQLDDSDTLTGGDGGEDILALENGDNVAVLDSTVHTGFEVLELSAAGAAVAFDNDGFGFTKVVLAEDLTQALTLDNLGDSTLEIQESQAGVITVGSTGDNDTLGLVINADALTTLPGLNVTDVETVNVSTTAETDDTTFTTIETDGVIALKFSGAGDIVITTVTDADATNNATTKIANVDLTEQTGTFAMGNLTYGTTFTLGNAGDSVLNAVAGFTDTFVFTTAFDNEVRINGGQFSGDLQDDKIDLFAFGLTDFNDLTFTDTGTDVEISSDAIEGTIVLTGIANVTEINASDFIF